MKERPIIFSAPMVRANIEGRKTKTRRVVKPQPSEFDGQIITSSAALLAAIFGRLPVDSDMDVFRPQCRYGAPGDRLWVKETWKYANWTEDGEPWIEYAAGGQLIRTPSEEWSDRVQDIWADLSKPNRPGPACDRRWRPSIHMPRWASRLTLEVVSVRAERLQEISEEDAKAEGVQTHAQYYGIPEDTLHGITPWYRYDGAACSAVSAVESFRSLWESINGVGAWAENPWVWVVEFTKIDNYTGIEGAKA